MVAPYQGAVSMNLFFTIDNDSHLYLTSLNRTSDATSMSEPTRQPTLTLRTSMSSSSRARPSDKDAPTAALVTPRGVKRLDRVEGESSAERTLQSDHLLQGRSHVFIAHNGERYQLRATRLGKLILTK